MIIKSLKGLLALADATHLSRSVVAFSLHNNKNIFPLRWTRGAFHLAKISGSTGWNANGTRGSRGNFPEQTDNLRSCSTFFVATDRSRNMPFHLHDGEIFPAISGFLWAGAHWLTCKINVVVKMTERREGEKTVGLQQDAQKDDDGGTFRHC